MSYFSVIRHKMSYLYSVLKIRNKFMILTKAILDLVNNPISRNLIATELRVGEQTVAFQMRHNKPNNRLTKMDALQAISKISGIPINEILEEEKTSVRG